MYLKSIEVQGFKSFAHKMKFEFHNGITGIVGPNGSGKSNVADAVRWVLGEQSAKQLRGSNMQDVIFAGTELRKPLSFASVAITLDNRDHILPVSYEEVTVMRRLYRSGESEYLLNGTSVRLRDIHEMFYDTGIGKEGYSIIGQGRIDQIISGKAEDRRELFDEAAGIVKFKRRKNQALKKLDSERQNLLRVSDILHEIEGRVEPLRLQSEKAKAYLDKKQKLRELEINVFLLETERVDKQVGDVEAKEEIVRADLEQKTEAFEHTRIEYETIERNIEELDSQIRALHAKEEENALSLQENRGKSELIGEQIRRMRQENERGLSRQEYLEEEIARRTENEKAQEAEKEKTEAALRAVTDEKNEKETALSATEEELLEAQAASDRLKSELIDLLNGRAGVKGRMQRYDTLREQIDIRSSEIARKELELAKSGEELNQLKESSEDEQKAAEKEVEDLREKIRNAEETVTALRAQIAAENERLEKQNQTYHLEASRLESLKNITERYEGYGNAIQTVMAKKGSVPGIRGVVADLISVPQKYELAIETALGGSIRNIVTDNQTTARSMIELLRKTKAGRATFLPLDALTARGKAPEGRVLKEQGVIGLASELVTVEPEYAILPEYLLGRTIVIDNIDHAIRIGNQYHHSLYMVTLDGDSFVPGGSMTGGAFKGRDNFLGRRREIEELTRHTKELRSAIAKKRAEIEEMRDRRDRLRLEAAEDTEKLQDASIALNTVLMQSKQAEEKAAEIEEQRRAIEREKAGIRKQIGDISEERKEVGKELRTSEEKEQELSLASEKLTEEIAQIEQRRNEEKAALEEIHLKEAEYGQKLTFIGETLRRVRWEKKALLEEKETLRGDMNANSGNLEEKEAEEKQTAAEIERLTAQGEKNRAEEERLGGIRDKMKEEHRGFFDRRDVLQREIAELDKEQFRLNAQKEKLLESIESQTSYLWEEYELTPSEAKKEKRIENTSYTALKKEAGSVRSAIRQLGDVNVNAIEEYKETSERFEFLRTQHDDLVKSEESLIRIIGELDTGMRRQFNEEFQKINVEFDKVFKELFGGGSGTLVLEEGEDVLEAGISIISQPPGKKLQNMMQLSGGEKSLTAIALLFAIQNLKPSPFCLLDEIEAALDEANVTRFTRYLHKLTEHTQFIVITHRRGTMSAADRLYGITMQEKGVSALVSVNLVKEELDA
ncbi:MAG: chromosome segregation protein SMC [Lachnospiraceae bacterium]|nr:chromosome segregation protein SMC [Lachnospiraceae bacterium]